MKYISVLILLVALGWTWSLATAEPSVSNDERHHVEMGVLQDVSAFIQEKFPKVSDVFCHQLYVELGPNPKTMIAHFRCNAVGENEGQTLDQIFEGVLTLKSDDEFQTWATTGGRITSPEIEFQTPMTIQSKPGQAVPDDEPKEPTGEKK